MVNEITRTISKLWDGVNMKCSSRRTVNEGLMNDLQEVVLLAPTITFCGEEDSMIWKFTSNMVYSSQSLSRLLTSEELSRFMCRLFGP
jgi:hypothetical protein